MTKSKKTARPISEEYAIQYENYQPSHFSMIPNFLSSLTYDHIDEKTGKKTVKRLSVYAKCLYQEICSIASGSRGACFKNRNRLAESCNMSAGAITNAKKELCQKFHQTEMTPLIKIEKKRKSSHKDGVKINSTTYDFITILNVWNYNNIFYLLRDNGIKQELSTDTESENDNANKAQSEIDTATREAQSSYDTKNNPNKKNPLFKEQQPTADADPVVSFKEKDFVSSVEELPQFKFLVKQGFTDKSAKDLVKKYSNDEIKKASDYVVMQINKKKIKGEKIKDVQAYFVNTLKFKYYKDKK